jgi:hypothetical protein
MAANIYRSDALDAATCSANNKGSNMSKAEETTTVQWFKNGDHPLDYAEDREGFENGEMVTFSAALCKAKEWEGGIVRYFRHPNIDGLVDCHMCGATMHEHGWLDDGGNGQVVCPGDFIVTTDGRHVVVQQPDRAEATDRAQQAQDMKDAARYRWLRQKSTVISWLDAESSFARLECEQLDAAIDKARAAQEAE